MLKLKSILFHQTLIIWRAIWRALAIDSALTAEIYIH